MAIYAASDFHGDYLIWKQIQKKLNSNDTLYFLGDAIDRLPDGIRILQEMIDDRRVIALKGNHEQMMCQVIPFILAEGYDDKFLSSAKTHTGRNWIKFNGGQLTIEYLLNHLTQSEILDLCAKIEHFKVKDTITVNGKIIYLSHSGFMPWKTMLKEDEFLWNREHINAGAHFPYKPDKSYIIHGHTPVIAEDVLFENMEGYKNNMNPAEIRKKLANPHIAKYAEGHKICLDLGTFYTGSTALINLETLEAEYFYDENLHNEWFKTTKDLTDEDIAKIIN